VLRQSPRVLACTLLILPACADSTGTSSSAGEDETTGSAATTEPATSATTTTPDSATSEPVPTTSEGSGGASDSATTGGDDTTTTTGDDDTTGTTGEEPSPWDGEPLPPAPPGDWQWIPIDGAICRDGSPTGIGVRYGKGDGLVIFFEGGGACFNAATCALNELWKNFGQIKFDAWALGIGQGGIFNLDNPDNPVGDWNQVYVPYCTGDVHAGDREDAGVDGVLGAHHFVGYRNVAAYLERLVPTFADVGHVLVTGQSAGGFGAALNYHRIAGAFADSKVTLLDDSGPPLPDMYLAPCLQKQWRSLWNLEAALPPDCPECFHEDGGAIYELSLYLALNHADQHLALISSERDSVIRTFFGYGLNDCAGGVYPAETFQEGLYELRDNVLGDSPVWGSFFLDGTAHTVIAGSSFYTAEVGGVPLTQWVGELLQGQMSHVNP
jgi:hypothetical protein